MHHLSKAEFLWMFYMIDLFANSCILRHAGLLILNVTCVPVQFQSHTALPL